MNSPSRPDTQAVVHLESDADDEMDVSSSSGEEPGAVDDDDFVPDFSLDADDEDAVPPPRPAGGRRVFTKEVPEVQFVPAPIWNGREEPEDDEVQIVEPIQVRTSRRSREARRRPRMSREESVNEPQDEITPVYTHPLSGTKARSDQQVNVEMQESGAVEQPVHRTSHRATKRVRHSEPESYQDSQRAKSTSRAYAREISVEVMEVDSNSGDENERHNGNKDLDLSPAVQSEKPPWWGTKLGPEFEIQTWAGLMEWEALTAYDAMVGKQHEDVSHICAPVDLDVLQQMMFQIGAALGANAQFRKHRQPWDRHVEYFRPKSSSVFPESREAFKRTVHDIVVQCIQDDYNDLRKKWEREEAEKVALEKATRLEDEDIGQDYANIVIPLDYVEPESIEKFSPLAKSTRVSDIELPAPIRAAEERMEADNTTLAEPQDKQEESHASKSPQSMSNNGTPSTIRRENVISTPAAEINNDIPPVTIPLSSATISGKRFFADANAEKVLAADGQDMGKPVCTGKSRMEKMVTVDTEAALLPDSSFVDLVDAVPSTPEEQSGSDKDHQVEQTTTVVNAKAPDANNTMDRVPLIQTDSGVESSRITPPPAPSSPLPSSIVDAKVIQNEVEGPREEKSQAQTQGQIVAPTTEEADPIAQEDVNNENGIKGNDQIAKPGKKSTEQTKAVASESKLMYSSRDINENVRLTRSSARQNVKAEDNVRRASMRGSISGAVRSDPLGLASVASARAKLRSAKKFQPSAELLQIESDIPARSTRSRSAAGKGTSMATRSKRNGKKTFKSRSPARTSPFAKNVIVGKQTKPLRRKSPAKPVSPQSSASRKGNTSVKPTIVKKPKQPKVAKVVSKSTGRVPELRSRRQTSSYSPLDKKPSASRVSTRSLGLKDDSKPTSSRSSTTSSRQTRSATRNATPGMTIDRQTRKRSLEKQGKGSQQTKKARVEQTSSEGKRNAQRCAVERLQQEARERLRKRRLGERRNDSGSFQRGTRTGLRSGRK